MLRRSHNLLKKIKNQKGAIIVEASLALPIFMFTIVIILSITNICAAQVVMTNTVNTVTQEIGKMSYLYCKLGGYNAQKSVDAKGANVNSAAASVIQSQDLESLIHNLDDAVNTISSEENPASSIGYMLLSNIIDLGENLIVNGFIKDVAETRLSNEDTTADDLLKHYGIQDGLGGVNFYMQIDFNSDSVYIIAKYKVRVLDLLGLEYDYNFTKASQTYMWNPATTYKSSSSEE